MSGRSEHKVALVTGGSAGIGRATAIAFANAGARVVVAARREREGQETVEAIRHNGGEALFVQTDVSRASDVETLVRKTVKAYGRLDWACNNAAIEGERASTVECSEENWDAVLDVNLKGVWLCLKHEIAQMLKQGGAIVNVGSVNSFIGAPTFAPYAASKHGLIGLTKSVAKEYAQAGIRVNAVCPGSIDTEMIQRVDGAPVTPDSWRVRLTPMQRIGSPDEIAQAVLWLCSDAASYVTGQSLVVDGGLMA